MSLFERIELYLKNNGIELNEKDYTPDGRLQIDGNTNEIIKFDFDIKQPTKKELDELKDGDILNSRGIRQTIKKLRASQITTLNKKQNVKDFATLK